MTRNYEIVYIFDSSIDEDKVNELLDKYHGILKTPESPDPVAFASHWGKRTLAYPIKGNEVGHYVVSRFETKPSVLPELERVIKLDPEVIRYLIVLNEGEVPPSPNWAGDDDDDEMAGDDKEGDTKDDAKEKQNVGGDE